MKSISAVLVFAVLALPAAAQESTKEPALKGYDPVAYFTSNEAVKGNPAISAEHEGKRYQFSSEAHREAFRQQPAKYLPQYAGYCAWAVSNNYLYPADPTVFRVQDGRLFLNANRVAAARFNLDVEQRIRLADKNWPGLSAKATGGGR